MHKKSKPTWTHFHSFFAALLTRIVKLKGPKIHLPFFLCIFLAHSQKPFQEKFSLSKVLSVEIKSLSCAADYWSSFQSIFSRSKTLIIATQKNSHANKAENLAHTTISSWGSRSGFKEKKEFPIVKMALRSATNDFKNFIDPIKCVAKGPEWLLWFKAIIFSWWVATALCTLRRNCSTFLTIVKNLNFHREKET